jgi:hypothetical protein
MINEGSNPAVTKQGRQVGWEHKFYAGIIQTTKISQHPGVNPIFQLFSFFYLLTNNFTSIGKGPPKNMDSTHIILAGKTLQPDKYQTGCSSEPIRATSTMHSS